MQLKYHGGDCCGRLHISGAFFDKPSTAFSKEWLLVLKTSRQTPTLPKDFLTNGREAAKYQAQVLNRARIKYGESPAKTLGGEFDAIMAYVKTTFATKCVEVVITDHQVHYRPEWVGKLKEHGFTFVRRFLNNGASWCNVFFWSDPAHKQEAPSWWVDEESK